MSFATAMVTASLPWKGGGSVEATAWVAGLIWVADFKVLGANYGLSVYPGVTNNALEFPPLGQDEG